MPWKEVDVLNLRQEFVLRSFEPGVSFAQLCQEYGISRKTGYKWKQRFLEQGAQGLGDQSRRPAHSPHQCDEDLCLEIVRLKLAHASWGPRKIRAVYGRAHPERELPSESTFKRVLDKAGLVKRRRARRSSEAGRLQKPTAAARPNQVWTVDFKGWWRTGDRQRFEPLTVRDAFSRYILCAQALTDGKGPTVRLAFERLFTHYGLPEVIKSDNGSPFACTQAPLGLTRLSAWWLALGVDLDRIPPARPDQNGAHERMHRDIALELECVAATDVLAQQAALDTWRTEYNEKRPHEALGMKVPADFYAPSPRAFAGADLALEYPLGHLRRRVDRNGTIKLHNTRISVSQALAGWNVGLKHERTNGYGLWFGRLRLGEVDLALQKFMVVSTE